MEFRCNKGYVIASPLIKSGEEQTTTNGLVVPQTVKSIDGTQRLKVFAAGGDHNGDSEIHPGAIIFVRANTNLQDITIDGEKMKFLTYRDIIGWEETEESRPFSEAWKEMWGIPKLTEDQVRDLIQIGLKTSEDAPQQ